MKEGSRAPFAELANRYEEEPSVELVMRRRQVHHREIAVWIVADVRYWKVEIPVAIRT